MKRENKFDLDGFKIKNMKYELIHLCACMQGVEDIYLDGDKQKIVITQVINY